MFDFLLNCTGGEPWPIDDEDLESEVETTIREWAESDGDLMGYFGWGDGETLTAHCGLHSPVDHSCQACFLKQQDELSDRIREWSEPTAQRLALTLRQDGYAEIKIADESMTFTFKQR
jgi:hypothetical protein